MSSPSPPVDYAYDNYLLQREFNCDDSDDDYRDDDYRDDDYRDDYFCRIDYQYGEDFGRDIDFDKKDEEAYMERRKKEERIDEKRWVDVEQKKIDSLYELYLTTFKYCYGARPSFERGEITDHSSVMYSAALRHEKMHFALMEELKIFVSITALPSSYKRRAIDFPSLN